MFDTKFKIETITDVQTLQMIVIALWKILDDIDTMSDIAKYNNIYYRNRVEHLQKLRYKYVISDGYDLFLNDDIHDTCDKCGKNTLRAKELCEGGGVECINPECDYWFCY